MATYARLENIISLRALIEKIIDHARNWKCEMNNDLYPVCEDNQHCLIRSDIIKEPNRQKYDDLHP